MTSPRRQHLSDAERAELGANAELLALYRRVSDEQPSAALDARILAMAAAAGTDEAPAVGTTISSPRRRRLPTWMSIAASSAVVLLGASLAWRMQLEQPLPQQRAIEAARDTAAAGDVAAQDSPTNAAMRSAEARQDAIAATQGARGLTESERSDGSSGRPSGQLPEPAGRVTAVDETVLADRLTEGSQAPAPESFPKAVRAEGPMTTSTAQPPAPAPAISASATEAPSPPPSAAAPAYPGTADSRAGTASADARSETAASADPGDDARDQLASAAASAPGADASPISALPVEARERAVAPDATAGTAPAAKRLAEPVRSPLDRQAWLDSIVALLDAGHPDEARVSLREWRRRFPNAELPERLRTLLDPSDPAFSPDQP